jgi:selenocysteine lyase/cysteine desulfurase
MLRAALDYLKGVGLARIERHSFALAKRLREGVAGLGYEMFTPPGNDSPIVSFVHGRDPKEVQKRLDADAVHVTLRENATQIRASVAAFNNDSDVQRLLKVLSSLA